jgi:hypothetical protein
VDGGKTAQTHIQNFDLGVFCEKQNVRAALKRFEWQRKLQFEWYRGPFPSQFLRRDFLFLGGSL